MFWKNPKQSSVQILFNPVRASNNVEWSHCRFPNDDILLEKMSKLQIANLEPKHPVTSLLYCATVACVTRRFLNQWKGEIDHCHFHEFCTRVFLATTILYWFRGLYILWRRGYLYFDWIYRVMCVYIYCITGTWETLYVKMHLMIVSPG